MAMSLRYCRLSAFSLNLTVTRQYSVLFFLSINKLETHEHTHKHTSLEVLQAYALTFMYVTHVHSLAHSHTQEKEVLISAIATMEW